jgi:UPF0755 protein
VRSFLRPLLAAVALVVLGVAGVGGYALHWNQQPLPVEAPAKVELHPGETFSAFALTLADQGLIGEPRLWSTLARLSGAARMVQAGEYWVRPGDTPQALLSRLLDGDVVSYQVQLIEGWTVRQTLQALAGEEPLRHVLGGVDPDTLLGALGLPEGASEGMFFPDTYSYRKGTSDADLLRLAYEKQQDVLAEAWAARATGLPYETPYEALIAASLIEKETGREEDRAIIAQVFVNRLERGMRLQTDPSVIFGIGAAFDGNLTRRHLKEDTPYNTYTRRGLPPTPIALVGRRSLEAALHPAAGEYLYFVSRGDGSSHFSVSLEEHEAAVRKYQLQ